MEPIAPATTTRASRADGRRPPFRPRRGVPPVLPALVALATALALGEAGAQALDVSAGDDGRVSIRASGTDAAAVASALGERTGISIVVTGDAATPIDVDIVDEPLEKAVAQLAPNHLLMRGNAAGAPIVEIVLMMPDGDDGGVESTEFLPTGEPADGVVSEDPSYAAQDGGAGDGSEPEYDASGQPIDRSLQLLRDPDRAAAVRAAAASAVAAQAAARAAELAAAGLQEPLQESMIDESTGLPPDDGTGTLDGGGGALPELEGSGLLNR